MQLLHFLPLCYLSFFLGLLAQIPVPRFLRKCLYGKFVRRYGVNTDELPKSLPQFRSFAEFFSRELKPESRPLPENPESTLISPVDGVLRSAAVIRDGKLEQIKGISYCLGELLADKEAAQTFEGGLVLQFYLSPRDYHHVHVPFKGRVVGYTYIPGYLWPVNSWGIEKIPNLFVRNERVVTYVSTNRGLYALIMIGATNVGKLKVEYAKLSYPHLGRGKVKTEVLSTPYALDAGEKLGSFLLGSSVVVAFEPKFMFDTFPGDLPQPVRCRQAL